MIWHSQILVYFLTLKNKTSKVEHLSFNFMRLSPSLVGKHCRQSDDKIEHWQHKKAAVKPIHHTSMAGDQLAEILRAIIAFDDGADKSPSILMIASAIVMRMTAQ